MFCKNEEVESSCAMHLVGQTDLEMGLQPGIERSYKLKVP